MNGLQGRFIGGILSAAARPLRSSGAGFVRFSQVSTRGEASRVPFRAGGADSVDDATATAESAPSYHCHVLRPGKLEASAITKWPEGGSGKVPHGGGGGYGNNGGGTAGGGHGDEEEEEVENFPHILSFQLRVAAEKGGFSWTSFPWLTLLVTENSGTNKPVLLEYLKKQENLEYLKKLSGAFAYFFRTLKWFDPLKILCHATFTEVHQRCGLFWKQLCVEEMLIVPLTVLPILGMLITDAKSSGSQGPLDHISGWPEYIFTVQQCIGTYIYKGLIYGSIGLLCTFVGQGIADWIISATRNLMQSVQVPPFLRILCGALCVALWLGIVLHFMKWITRIRGEEEKKKRESMRLKQEMNLTLNLTLNLIQLSSLIPGPQEEGEQGAGN